MLEFNLFLIDYWYLSVPLFLSLLLWFLAESRRGGKRIDCNELTFYANKKSACLLDVRAKADYDNGTIAGSINIPYDDLSDRMHELAKYENLPIVLICNMGRNAALAGEKLSQNNFVETCVLKGGIMTWQQEGLPIIKP